MSGSLNRVMLIGNLCRDPEVRTTQNGTKVANLSVATNETWRDKNSGEKKEKAEFHRCVVFGNLAGVLESYARKGTKLYLEGSLQTRKWQDQSGADKYTTEVVLQGFGGKLVLLDGKQADAPADDGGSWEAPTTDAPDDEIPF